MFLYVQLEKGEIHKPEQQRSKYNVFAMTQILVYVYSSMPIKKKKSNIQFP